MLMRRFSHFICIDWSGARGERQPGIAVAVAVAGANGDAPPALVREGHRWSRREVADWLIELTETKADALIGVDFSAAFAFVDRGCFFPEWADSPPSAKALWALVERLCADDAHLEVGSFLAHGQAHRHFRHGQGDVGDLFGGGIGRLRVVEQHQRATGQASSWSNSNLVGAGQVGKASLTGMRMLHRIGPRLPNWPFDPVPSRGPLLIEIYTTMAARAAGVPAGRSKLRSGEALDAALAQLGSRPTERFGPISDHASDALLTAAWMRAKAGDPALWSPALLTDELAQTEGWTFGVI